MSLGHFGTNTLYICRAEMETSLGEGSKSETHISGFTRVGSFYSFMVRNRRHTFESS
jgi:hypothetical protein